MTTPPDQSPGEHTATFAALLAGIAAIIRAFFSRKKTEKNGEEFEAAATRAALKSSLSARVQQLEDRQDRTERGIDRLEESLKDTRDHFRQQLGDAVERLERKIEDTCS